jgi:uncharacterized caspase-like protein
LNSFVRLGCLFLVLLIGQAHAARLALVIGNSAYLNDALRNPVNDALAMEQKLGSLDFKVERIDNLKRDQIGRLLTGFSARIKPGDEVVVFYAGHGVQIKGINYLPAVDAKIESEEDVPLNSLNLNALMDRIDESKAGLKLLFLDACRNNPYARSFRSLDRGLARVSNAPSGTLIHFATRPGSVADDGRGANGLYTTQLLRHIDTPGLPVELMLKRVAASVAEETKGQQEPWIEGSIRGDFFFKPAIPEPVVSAILVSPAEIERQAWETVRASNTLAGYSAFLTEYPNGPYSGAARVAKASIPDPVALANERDAKGRAEAERLARAEAESRRLELEASKQNKSGGETTRQEKMPANQPGQESGDTPRKSDGDSSLLAGIFSIFKPSIGAAQKPESPQAVVQPDLELPWIWPTAGRVVQAFEPGKSKGLSLSGNLGDPVLAAADGKVVFSGRGLRGYGNLIIVKHPADMMSVYAHNRSVLVKEGESVVRGQRIAELGDTDSDRPKLHFEVRRSGKPIDPLLVLQTSR